MTLEAIETVHPDLLEEQEKIASGLHGVIGMEIGSQLHNFVRPNKLGYVLNSSTTYRFIDNPPKRQPDVSYVSIEKMPVPLDEELTFAPDIAVEVVSRYDVLYEVEQKVIQYLQAGVKLIWIVRPLSKNIEVYRLSSGLTSHVIGLEGELDGEDVLPGFKMPVKALFE